MKQVKNSVSGRVAVSGFENVTGTAAECQRAGTEWGVELIEVGFSDEQKCGPLCSAHMNECHA